jgi:hypothetical protein
MRIDTQTQVYLTVSLLGLVTAGLFLDKGAQYTENGYYAYIIFSGICILGIVAALFPKQCSHRFMKAKLDPSRFTVIGDMRIVHGHHIICDGFRDHELKIKGKTFCAACLGLLMGAILAIFIGGHHFLWGYNYSLSAGILGIIFTLLGLIYIPVLKPKNPLNRFVYNILFVVGFSLLLAVVDNAGRLSLDLVTVGLCVFWMYSRIQFSQWNHNKTCRECNEKCEYYI